MLVAAFFVAISVMLIPQAVWERMSFSTDSEGGTIEGRARVYTAAVEYLPEYIVAGVGAGNFWGDWGSQTDFAHGLGVTGTHNGFLQVAIYWGLAGLLGLLWIIWRAYRCLPRHDGKDPLLLCLIGVSLSLCLVLMTIHNLYSKEFAIGLGLLVAGECWIWPGGRAVLTRRMSNNRRRSSYLMQ
jgi:hypothetical protein